MEVLQEQRAWATATHNQVIDASCRMHLAMSKLLLRGIPRAGANLVNRLEHVGRT